MIIPFSIGILSWKSPATLFQTLSSYRDNGLLDLTDDVSIYFQEISDTDLAITEEFGISRVYGDERNIGIGPAIQVLMQDAKYEHMLFLEEDWRLVADDQTTFDQLQYGQDLLQTDRLDFCRFRSIGIPGDPLYTRQFAGDPMRSPEHLIEQVHSRGILLARDFEPAVQLYNSKKASFVYADSFYANYSNNPFLCSTKFWLDNIAPSDRGGISLEGEIRKTWRDAGHRVGYNVPGLFSHQRIDR